MTVSLSFGHSVLVFMILEEEHQMEDYCVVLHASLQRAKHPIGCARKERSRDCSFPSDLVVKEVATKILCVRATVTSHCYIFERAAKWVGRTSGRLTATLDVLSSQEHPKGYQNGWVSKRQVLGILTLGIWVPIYFGTHLGVSFSSTQRGLKTDGLENGKFSEF